MKFPKRASSGAEGIGAENYLRLSDGQSITGTPRGELHTFYQKWPKGGTKEIFAEPAPGAAPRYKINIVVLEDNKFVAKVFEFGPRVYDQFSEASEEIDLSKTKVKISRRGTEKNTQWIVMPLGPVDPKALKLIDAVELHSLAVAGSDAPKAGTFESELEVEDADGVESY